MKLVKGQRSSYGVKKSDYNFLYEIIQIQRQNWLKINGCKKR